VNTIKLNTDTIKKLNESIKKGNKPVKKPFPYKNIKKIIL